MHGCVQVCFLACSDVSVHILLYTVYKCASMHNTVYIDMLMCAHVVCMVVCKCVVIKIG